MAAWSEHQMSLLPRFSNGTTGIHGTHMSVETYLAWQSFLVLSVLERWHWP